MAFSKVPSKTSSTFSSSSSPPQTLTVITSDLDLRDLHRNIFLTNIQDLRAQLENVKTYDREEVSYIANQAINAKEMWTGMIKGGEYEEGKRIVERERGGE
mmetsp:Transcript_4094/g.8216  ORF Transcript_4094/g.8216 Transcript_4094/m.8216 type:complete len:101 (-) Transcript_4094:43-345(-)